MKSSGFECATGDERKIERLLNDMLNSRFAENLGSGIKETSQSGMFKTSEEQNVITNLML